ncbi:hypothetical protein EVAR_48202_1 [Eumeta japonica]|uniref:Uncharacterized protein n=1 Tax=Eumeta variegata TaxID=151549 RepID=A0A4C1XXA8_EUMVA|nr:hypothetical protein EVAR_48202_1 [Eumeta japonica]
MSIVVVLPEIDNDACQRFCKISHNITIGGGILFVNVTHLKLKTCNETKDISQTLRRGGYARGGRKSREPSVIRDTSFMPEQLKTKLRGPVRRLWPGAPGDLGRSRQDEFPRNLTQDCPGVYNSNSNKIVRST